MNSNNTSETTVAPKVAISSTLRVESGTAMYKWSKYIERKEMKNKAMGRASAKVLETRIVA